MLPSGAVLQTSIAPGQSRAGRDADKDSFLLRQLHRAPQGVIALDRHQDVEQLRGLRVLGQLGDEVRGPALHQVGTERRVALGDRAVVVARLRDAAAHDRGVVGLADHDLGLGPLLFEHPGDALEGAAGAETGHPVVQGLILEISEDLLGGGLRVDVCVGLVFELTAQEPAVGLGQLDGLQEHSRAFLGSRGQHHFGAQEAHHLASLDARSSRPW